jgi:hypothetical protein
MFTFSEPSDVQIENFLAEQKDLPFSYGEVGASKGAIPSDYPINHHRVQLDNGENTFVRSKNAIQNWTMYKLEWTRLYPSDTPVVAREVVCVIVNHGFCWSLNPCRIVYTLEEKERLSDSVSHSELCPDTAKKAKKDFSSNGITQMIRFGMSFYHLPARIIF